MPQNGATPIRTLSTVFELVHREMVTSQTAFTTGCDIIAGVPDHALSTDGNKGVSAMFVGTDGDNEVLNFGITLGYELRPPFGRAMDPTEPGYAGRAAYVEYLVGTGTATLNSSLDVPATSFLEVPNLGIPGLGTVPLFFADSISFTPDVEMQAWLSARYSGVNFATLSKDGFVGQVGIRDIGDAAFVGVPIWVSGTAATANVLVGIGT